MSKGTIRDPTVRIKPSEALIDFILTLDNEAATPQNVANIQQLIGGRTAKKILDTDIPQLQFSKAELEVLNGLPKETETNACLSDLSIECDDSEDDEDDDIENVDATKPVSKSQAAKQKRLQKEKQRSKLTINLNDLKWIERKLTEKRSQNDDFKTYLHQLLRGSKLVLPKNEIIERSPELEARCVRLRLEQEARVYNAMTKNVDSARTKLPEDTISYQIKQINRQLIAVAQFVFSVAAGFAFGFLGVELMIGNLDFGFRLLLGIICALVIALAEIYFLAKKLNEEYDIAVEQPKVKVSNAVPQSASNGSATKQHLE